MSQQQSTTNKSADKSAATHVAKRGHESRVDEMSEERATHLEAPEGPWVRPSSLDAPEPQEGMVQRWVRRTMKGEADPRNWNRSMREGWRPRQADTVESEWKQFAIAGADVSGIIAVDDLVLCEMPKERFQQRADYYNSLTANQMAAVEHDLENAQVQGHPIVVSQQTSVTHPSRQIGGRKVEAADNE